MRGGVEKSHMELIFNIGGILVTLAVLGQSPAQQKLLRWGVKIFYPAKWGMMEKLRPSDLVLLFRVKLQTEISELTHF